MDVVTGGYSGTNIIDGASSGASRKIDDPSVTSASSVGRIAWLQNCGSANDKWRRHDVSRRARGIFETYVSRGVDGDGDIDLFSTRGNSGQYDGVFWLDRVRTKAQRPFFLSRPSGRKPSCTAASGQLVGVVRPRANIYCSQWERRKPLTGVRPRMGLLARLTVPRNRRSHCPRLLG